MMDIHTCAILVELLSLIVGGLAVNVLVGLGNYSVLNSYHYLSVSDTYYVVMQPDCDLILYNQSGVAIMHTDSSQINSPGGNSLNCSLWMQSDGNCVIYNFTSANWTENSPSNSVWAEQRDLYPNSLLLLEGDGSLDIYSPSPTVQPEYNKYFTLTSFLEVVDVNESSPVNYPVFDPHFPNYTEWVPSTSLNDYPYMPAGYFLSAGQRLVESAYELRLNASDCSLHAQQNLLQGGNRTLWNSGTTDGVENRPCQLELLENGTLQVRDLDSNQVYWNSNASGNSSVSWILMLDPDNGNLSVSDIQNSKNLLWTNAAPALSPSPQPSPPSPEVSQTSTSSSKPKGSVVWPVVVGVIVGAFTVAAVALALYLYARERFLDPADKALQKRLQATGGYSQALSQAKIKQATKNYQTVIGRGGFGDVFYGQLADGQEVAAKVLSMNSGQSKQEFYNEIELLSKVHHKYLVSLLGYSSTRTHQVLVYEYMGGGDLRRRLQGETEPGNPLSWRERTSIMLQVAEGLEYLHDKCSPPIIHRDIKSNNILLTNKMVAKVADFGMSKLKVIGQEDATHVTTVVKGTPGYLDPEYHETGLLTEKSDVYAFGVVLMEILTGQHHMHIAHRVGEAWRREQFDGLAEPQLGDDFDRTELVSLVELALWCVNRSSLERPFMRQVVRRLHELQLVPSETSVPTVELGEESPLDIELVMMGSSGNLSRDTIPLSGSSSSGVNLGHS